MWLEGEGIVPFWRDKTEVMKTRWAWSRVGILFSLKPATIPLQY